MKYILFEFFLNLLNIHWWLIVVLGSVATHPLRRHQFQPNGFTRTLNWIGVIKPTRVDGVTGGVLSIIPIGLFENFVGIEKSFGAVDIITVLMMAFIVNLILEKVSGNKEQAETSSGSADKKPSVNPDHVASKLPTQIREINRYGTGSPSTPVSKNFSNSPSTPVSKSSSLRQDLEELKSLLEDGLIDEADYKKKKSQLLEKL